MTELPGQAAELRVVSGGVLVDVDHSARHDLHTGIQHGGAPHLADLGATITAYIRWHGPMTGPGGAASPQPERHRVLHRGEAPSPASPRARHRRR